MTKVWVELGHCIYDFRLVAEDGFEQKIQAIDDHPCRALNYHRSFSQIIGRRILKFYVRFSSFSS